MIGPMRDDPMFEIMVEKHSSMVYKLAFARTRNSVDAQDVFQEVFLRYIRRKPEFQSEEHEKAWFLRVTINCSKNLFASFLKNRTDVLSQNVAEMATDEKILDEFLMELPQKYRTVIHLFYYEDMKILEIGELLDLKESTVKMQLTRARKLLKEYMERRGHYAGQGL